MLGEMEQIRVILADDYIPYRWALMAVLADEPSIAVIEEASDGDEAVRKSLDLQPDVLVSDRLNSFSSNVTSRFHIIIFNRTVGMRSIDSFVYTVGIRRKAHSVSPLYQRRQSTCHQWGHH